MAVARGTCPGCGAAVEFGIGSSVAKVCEYCRATVVRSDAGLETLGKIAELAKVPSLIGVGDSGTLAGHPFTVAGRLQLDHGKGPWDEFYICWASGAWGWLAYDDGKWYATTKYPTPPGLPPFASLEIERDVPIGSWGVYRVVEAKSGRLSSAEGELPFAVEQGETFYYSDLRGPRGGFATLDYGDDGDDTADCDVFLGRELSEAELVVTGGGAGLVADAGTQSVKCLSCGGDLPLISGARASRIGCSYCGAVSDLAALQVIERQQQAYSRPEIPLGTRGTFQNVEYVVIAYLRRSIKVEGERYPWEEYLLWAKHVGFRWVVKGDGSWKWATGISAGDLDLRGMPKRVGFGGKTFARTEKGKARVDYVLGEVFWKCAVGEKVRVMDFACGKELLTRELSEGEVQWTYSAPIPWAALARGFGLRAG